jgi:hypothetical protein
MVKLNQLEIERWNWKKTVQKNSKQKKLKNKVQYENKK